jgi:ATP-dependent DNA helicase RecG
MDLNEIKKLTNKDCCGGELKTVEFKTSTANLASACQTLCGFLNTEGGVVLIGVKDDGRLVGQQVTNNTRQEIARELKKFEPAAPINVSYVPLTEDQLIITMEVPAGTHCPYIYDGRPYQRLESSTSIMPQHLYEQLLVKRGQLNYSWEEFLTEEYTIADLDHDEIYKTVKQAVAAKRIPEDVLSEDRTDILSRLELTKNGKLKNAAVVLFGKETFPNFSQCMIKMARFQGTSELDDFVDNQQVYGHAFKILTEANEFMRKHLNIASFYQPDDFVRIDKPTLPSLVIREALINAICHRNYQNYSAITLAIFDDRLEVWNSGFLPKELKIEDLKKKHGSYPRNKLIAEVFYKRGLIERWGTGTLKMLERCREHGLPDPQFEEYSNGLSVKFLFETPIGPMRITNTKACIKQPINKQEPILTMRQAKIIVLLEEFHELTALSIKEKLKDHVIATRTLRDDLIFLKKHNKIYSRGRGKNAVWFKASM